MARKLRVEYPGALYHVMSRGDHGDPLFEDDRDRERFVETLGEAALKTGWQVHAHCLMSNHFHLVVETPQGNLAAGMKWLLGTYTGRFNRRHKLFGHLFSGRYESLVVDGPGTGYLKTGDDDDLEMGGGAPGHGELEQRLESAGRGAKESSMKGESTQSENRPLHVMAQPIDVGGFGGNGFVLTAQHVS